MMTYPKHISQNFGYHTQITGLISMHFRHLWGSASICQYPDPTLMNLIANKTLTVSACQLTEGEEEA